MTTVPVMADIKKLSFAKVAASGTREALSSRVAIPVATPSNSAHKSAAPSVPAPVVPSIVAIPHTSPAQTCQTPKITKRPTPSITEHEVLQDATDAMNDLSLEQRTPNLVVNGTSPNAPTRTGRGTIPKDSTPEEKADSNSELGTKPPSLDGKSIASGTTFALDEKESLRPDDSASMKAAAEDDDAFSTRGSILAGSRMGSEQRGVKMIQFGDVPTARIIQTVPESQNLESPTPHSGESSQLPQAETKMPLGNAVGGSDAFNNAVYGQGPDEKLLEAMNSQKDRLFLLRLEKQVMEFVQDSKEPFMDLPPSNSFCRMLTHKLADYYRMTHSFEQTTASVRIFRTPFCRVPPSLASIVQASGVSENSTPPPVVLPKKIMRRGEDGSTAPPSANPSKPASEVGSDSKDKPLAKEKMTREEREEAYNKARQRIFGNSENTGESTPENEDSKGLSRASSISGKDKSNTAKRGKVSKRRDDNDNFETRSQYAALYGHPHQPWQAQYVPMNGQQYNTQMQQPPANAMYSQMPSQPVYMGGNQSQLQNMVPNNGFQYPNMPAYPQGGQPQYQQMNRPNAMQPGFPSGPPMAAGPQQNWQQGYNPGSAPYQSRPVPTPGNGIPYAYGQLPANANPNDPKSQHPIPGSYNRHAFNPKTHPFVPAVNGMPPMQPQPFNAPGPLHGSPQMAPAAMYPNYPPSYGNTGSFNMARQGSNNGMPPFHPQPPQPPHMAPTHSGPPLIPNKPAIPQGPSNHTGGANHNANFPHLPNYGNPATLPQKPPNPTSGV